MTLGSKNKISPLATPRTYKGECGNCRAGTDTLGLCGCAGVTGASLKLSYSPFVSETRSHVIGQAGLQVNPPASAHPVLGLQGCTTMLSFTSCPRSRLLVPDVHQSSCLGFLLLGLQLCATALSLLLGPSAEDLKGSELPQELKTF